MIVVYNIPMKIIFLDIDGVLNSSNGNGPYISDMEIEKLALLKGVVDATKSGVVITSDRRYSVIDMKDKLDAFALYQIPVIGSLRLPNDDDFDNRGKQILDYLSSSNEEIEAMVILDDNDDGIKELFSDNFILLNRFYGLTNEICLKVKEILFN